MSDNLVVEVSDEFEKYVELEEDLSEGDMELGQCELEDDENERKVVGVENSESYQVGALVQGEILDIDRQYVYVQLRDGIRGVMNLSEFFCSETEKLYASLGSNVIAKVVSVDGDRILLSKRRSSCGHLLLEYAFLNGVAVSGYVERLSKNGYYINVDGVQALCSFTQMFRDKDTDPSRFLGKMLKFYVVRYSKRGKIVALSRLLYLKDAKRKGGGHKKLVVGAIVEGVVDNVNDYGIFVDIHGTIGMVHVSEVSYSHVDNLKSLYKPGDSLKVKVISHEVESNGGRKRIGLSIRQLGEDPLNAFSEKVEVGSSVEGRVVGKTKYGCLIELEKDVVGLLHVMEMSRDSHLCHEMLKGMNIGDSLSVTILGIDRESRRIPLSLLSVDESVRLRALGKYSVGSKVKCVIESLDNEGFKVRVDEVLQGLVKDSGIEVAKGKYSLGAEVELVVLGIDMGREMLILGSQKQEKHTNRDGFQKKEKSHQSKVKVVETQKSSSTGFGTFGDIFNELQKK